MHDKPITWRGFFLSLGLSFIAVLLIYNLSIFDTRTTLVFCDVGQGDAAYIRVENKIDILIDAGPNRKVLDCLGKYMPFYDRKIELAFLSHPQKDHFGGYLFILDRYKVTMFISNGLENKSNSFSDLKNKLREKKIKIKILSCGDKVIINNFRLDILWPKKSAISAFSNPNLSSQVILLSDKNIKVLFTGDLEFNKTSTSFIEILRRYASQNDNNRVDILKVPHHGSKNGLTETLIKKIKPKIGIISLGKNNAYGHPAKEVLDILRKYNVKIRRTDEEGNIVFKF